MLSSLAGGCVCGGVRYVTEGLPLRITICHCTWCQRRTGTAFGTECVFRLEAVSVQGEPLRSYRHRSDLTDRWVEQDFCSACGSNIGLRLEAVPELRSLSIGSFDDPRRIGLAEIPVRHIFTRSRLPVSSIPDGVECHELHFRR